MNRPRMTWLLPLVAAVCACDDAPREAVTSCQQVQILAAPVKTDILFVVDDSPSMANSQANLAVNFQAFVDRLWNSPVENDFQIGVTTSSVHRYVAASASYPETFANSSSAGATCQDLLSYLEAAGIPDPYYYPAGALVSVTGNAAGDPNTQRIQNIAGTSPPRILLANSSSLVTDFTENAKVGVCGSSKEQGLEAARLAIQKAVPGGANEGFLRSGARLAVIILSDNDDCSDPEKSGVGNTPTDCTSYAVTNYESFFKNPIAGEDRHVVVGAIIAADASGTTQGCAEDVSHGPVRYRAFAEAFGSSAIVGNICDASFHDTLENIAGLIDPGQTMPLSGTPPSPQLMSVRVNKADGSTVNCQVGVTGDPAANAIYLEPSASDPARLTFSGACTLQQGDRVEVNILCAE